MAVPAPAQGTLDGFFVMRMRRTAT
jgi:hypothetical protein